MDQAKTLSFFLLRIVSGFLIFQAGASKILGWFAREDAGPRPELMSQIGIGGLIELIGGTMIMLGLFTKPAAFILSGTMAVAYFQFHQPQGTWPAQNNGVPAVALCFIFFMFAFHGAGQWSLDAMINKKSESTA